MGVPLHRLKDIRLLYGESPWGVTPISFETPSNPPIARGHVIAARITSENPDEASLRALSFHHLRPLSVWQTSNLSLLRHPGSQFIGEDAGMREGTCHSLSTCDVSQVPGRCLLMSVTWQPCRWALWPHITAREVGVTTFTPGTWWGHGQGPLVDFIDHVHLWDKQPGLEHRPLDFWPHELFAATYNLVHSKESLCDLFLLCLEIPTSWHLSSLHAYWQLMVT